MARPPGRRGPGVAGDPKGDIMEPGPERFADPESASLTDQDQEGGLEGILGIVRVAQDAVTDAHDHRRVALDEGQPEQEPCM